MTQGQVDIKDIAVGDIFSESSHYRVTEVTSDLVKFEHIESKQTVELDHSYVSKLLKTANQFEKEVTVGKEDKFWTKNKIEAAIKKAQKDGTTPPNVKEGDLEQEGIRTIFEKIYEKQAIAVCFKKADVPLSAKKLKELQEAQITEGLARIKKAKDAKKGVADEATKVLAEIQANPILPYTPGEDRILIGWKEQFKSRDGRYDCFDASINEIRPVNLNTLQWLVYDGVRYNVEK